MTYAEVLADFMQCEGKMYEGVCNIYGLKLDSIKLIKLALQKQVSKESIRLETSDRKLCPICENEITFCDNYCDSCGQAIALDN